MTASKFRILRALTGAALAAPFASLPAWAADCGPLQQVMSLDLTALPNGLFTMPVKINGSDRQMLFSTGGAISTLTQSAADSLGLHPVSTRTKLVDSAGNATQQYVTLDSFVIGGMQAKGLEMMIAPEAKIGNTPADGVFAGDIMVRYDEEMDFANKKLMYFLPDHCDGHVVHWTTAPAAVVPFRRSAPGSRNVYDSHIRFHVTMDGKDLLAVLNTGTVRSTMNAKSADGNFNVTQDSPNTTPLGNLDGRKVVGYVFKSISFGNVTVNNPHVVILPNVIGLNDPNNGHRTDSLIKRVDDDLDPDISIGMDVLKKLHIYVATKEQNLYITAADDQAAAAQ